MKLDSDSEGQGFESLRAGHQRKPKNLAFMRVCGLFCLLKRSRYKPIKVVINRKNASQMQVRTIVFNL